MDRSDHLNLPHNFWSVVRHQTRHAGSYRRGSQPRQNIQLGQLLSRLGQNKLWKMLRARASNQVLLITYLDCYVKDFPHRLTWIYNPVGSINVWLCMFQNYSKKFGNPQPQTHIYNVVARGEVKLAINGGYPKIFIGNFPRPAILNYGSTIPNFGMSTAKLQSRLTYLFT